MCLGTVKLGCFSLHNWVFLFYLLYVHACYAQKENMQRTIKAKRIKMVLKMIASVCSWRCGSYRMYLESDSPHQAVMIMCELKWFSHISNRHYMHTHAILRYFSHTTCNILCYFWYMCKYNVIWPPQGFTCINVCSLNYLDLFLEYKIG